MKRLFTVSLIAVLVFTTLAAYTHYDLVIRQIDRFLAAPGVPVEEEPEPIVLHEGLELPTGPEGAPPAEISDFPTLARQITVGAATDYARMEAVYDWITANFAYDLDKLNNIDDYGSGAAYMLQAGKGICHDYADLALALLTALGLEATYESGDVYPEEGKTERHAWNHVKVDGTWYAMDSTWGAGFIVEEENRFIHKPRRLYLTTPAELSRLHSDPAYKEEREHAYRREETVQAAPVYLPTCEQDLLELMNRYRAERKIPLLSEESRLLEMARRNAARYAALEALDEEYTLEEMESELNRIAPDLRINKAGMYAFLQWAYEPSSAGQLFDQIIQEQKDYLVDGSFSAATVAVVRQGDLTAVVQIYLSYY